MEKTSYTELSIIQETKKLLEDYGETEILYATAEFEPFTNQQRPDLKFISNNSKDKVFFIEYKLNPLHGFDDLYFDNILEHRAFIDEDISAKIEYAFATNVDIDPKYQQLLSDKNITVFTGVESGEKLSKLVINWTIVD